MPHSPLPIRLPFHFLLALLFASLLAACGGGGETGPALSGADTTAKAVTRSESIKAASATTSWTLCAQEGQVCAFAGTASVRYGTDMQYVIGTYTTQVSCSNSIFGDPASGVAKSCWYSATTAAVDTSWVYCANESQFCAFTGTANVRYGAGGRFATRSFIDGVACSNAIFGDPAGGVAKSCSYQATTTTTPPPPTQPPTNWIACASENQVCVFNGAATVRYGAGSSYATGNFTNGVSCSNAVFGDPAFGVAKSCSYVPTFPLPIVTAQPQSVIVSNGQSASFAVTATSSAAPTYQWSRNGVAIAGATTSTYSIPVTQLADSGAVFRVVVTNNGGAVTSAAAGLTVNAVASTGATAQRLFSDQSLWNARPTQFTLGTASVPTSTYFPTIASGAYSVAGAIASVTDPAVTVLGQSGKAGIWIPDAEAYAASVVIPHWPATVAPADGTDGHADIIDVSNNRIHSFWQLAKGADGLWRAAQYTWTPLDGSGWGTPAEYMQGSRAAGVVPIAGVIRVNEVNDGLPMYRHALAMSLAANGLSASPTYVFPATNADGDAATTNTGQIPEGARLMLPATFDATGITNAALLKVVRTLQAYGAYVVDRNVGTPYVIYVENGSNFNLMPAGWDNAIAAQLQMIRAALRPVASVTQWVDATGTVFAPETNLNLLSMRGYWYTDVGPSGGTFDSWQRAVVFPANGKATSQINNGGRSVPSFMAATPAAGTRFRIRASATGGATMRLTISKMGPSFDSGVMRDGDEIVLTWPSGATGAVPSLRVSSGPQGGGRISATMVQLPN